MVLSTEQSIHCRFIVIYLSFFYTPHRVSFMWYQTRMQEQISFVQIFAFIDFIWISPNDKWNNNLYPSHSKYVQSFKNDPWMYGNTSSVETMRKRSELLIRMSKSIGIFHTSNKVVLKYSLLIVYNCFVYPYIAYPIEVCGTASVKNLMSVLRLQNRAVILITSFKTLILAISNVICVWCIFLQIINNLIQI